MSDIYLKHDITFFERWWSGEVTVAYAVKNNPNVREFLMTWSMEKDQPYEPPAKFYSSSDNGLLHVLLMKWFILGLKRVSSIEEIANGTWPEQRQNVALECVQKFANLNKPVTNLGPYFSFIMCARVALGMQGSGGKYLGPEVAGSLQRGSVASPCHGNISQSMKKYLECNRFINFRL